MTRAPKLWDRAAAWKGKYRFIELYETADVGLRIVLERIRPQPPVRVTLKVAPPFSYSVVEESSSIGHFYEMLDELGAELCADTFVDMGASPLARELAEEGSGGTAPIEGVFHLRLICADSSIELVSVGEPELSAVELDAVPAEWSPGSPIAGLAGREGSR